MNTGKAFETLVHDYYKNLKDTLDDSSVIKLDEKVAGPDGARQCDITIEHLHLGLKFRTLIECKDHAASIQFGVIDEFASKLADLKFNKGIIVSRSGFQSGAVAKANRMGIDLFTFSEANKAAGKFGSSLPILHLDYRFSEISVTFDAAPDILTPIAFMRCRNGACVAHCLLPLARSGAICRPSRIGSTWRATG